MTFNPKGSAEKDRRSQSVSWNFAHILQLLAAKSMAATGSKGERSRAARIHYREARNALHAARVIARQDFAAARGWRPANRPFTIDELRAEKNVVRGDHYDWQLSPMDHPEYFRIDRRPWHPVAIVSHEYSDFSSSLELASQKGLTAELLPASWYFPSHCNAVVYTAARVAPL